MIPKDFYKKAVFYYVLAPVLLAVWPCLVAFVYLPNSQKAFINEQKIYTDANTVMMDILTYDPDRTKSTAAKNPQKGFDYFTALSDAARLCNISTPTYNSQPKRLSEGKEIQDSTITLQSVPIETFANFLFLLQKRWANLECENIILDKQKGFPNVWKVTVKLRYHF